MTPFDPNNLPTMLFRRSRERASVQNPNDYEEVLQHRIQKGELTQRNINDILDRGGRDLKDFLEAKVATKERERAYFQRIHGKEWDKRLPDGTLATDWRELDGTRKSDNQ